MIAMAISLCAMVVISRAPIEWCIGDPRFSSIVSYKNNITRITLIY